MTHDPLCPYDPTDECSNCGFPGCECDECQCDLIARVREDGYKTGYSAAMEDGWGGYDIAVRDAVEAVKALEFRPTQPEMIIRPQAVAAIEALGSKR